MPEDLEILIEASIKNIRRDISRLWKKRKIEKIYEIIHEEFHRFISEFVIVQKNKNHKVLKEIIASQEVRRSEKNIELIFFAMGDSDKIDTNSLNVLIQFIEDEYRKELIPHIERKLLS